MRLECLANALAALRVKYIECWARRYCRELEDDFGHQVLEFGNAVPFEDPTDGGLYAIIASVRTTASDSRRARSSIKAIRSMAQYRKLQGWRQYFHCGSKGRAYKAVDEYVYDRVRNFLRRRHKVSSQGTRQFPGERVYGSLGVLRLQGPRAARA